MKKLALLLLAAFCFSLNAKEKRSELRDYIFPVSEPVIEALDHIGKSRKNGVQDIFTDAGVGSPNGSFIELRSDERVLIAHTYHPNAQLIMYLLNRCWLYSREEAMTFFSFAYPGDNEQSKEAEQGAAANP